MKRKSKIIIVLTSLVIISILIFAAIFFQIFYDDIITLRREYSCTITSDGNFSILAPIPINDYINIDELAKDLVVKQGQPHFSINQTEYGLALNISGNGIVEVSKNLTYKYKARNNSITPVGHSPHKVILSMTKIFSNRHPEDNGSNRLLYDSADRNFSFKDDKYFFIDSPIRGESRIQFLDGNTNTSVIIKLSETQLSPRHFKQMDLYLKGSLENHGWNVLSLVQRYTVT